MSNELMSYESIVYLHLATVVPSVFIGGYLLIRRKGSPIHKTLGKFYMLCMAGTALIALMLPAQVGPALWGHFGWLHSLCLVTLISVVLAYLGVRNGNIRVHKTSMVGLYCGGILIAGGFTLMPGRLLHSWVFGG